MFKNPSLYLRCLLCLVILFLSGSGVLSAQQIQKEAIKKSDQFYWGEAVSENEKEASDRALGMLTHSIAVTVSSTFEQTVKEVNKDFKSTVENILKTYSTATLKNVRTLRSSTSSGIEVFHYIEKSEVKNIFDARVKMVQSIYDRALALERDENFGYALKLYYFAIVLMNSVPEQIIKHDEVNLVSDIPYRINTIIGNARFVLKGDKKISESERELVFDVRVSGKPAQFLEFSVWDGTNQVHVQALDGEGILRLYGASVKFEKLDIAIKYLYYESREEIKEVAELWNVVLMPSFKNSKQVVLKEGKVTPVGFALDLADKNQCKVLPTVGSETEKLLGVLRSGDLNAIKSAYSADLYLRDKLVNFVRHNNPAVVDDKVKADVNKTFSGWEVRKIRLLNRYPSLNKQSLDYLVLDFTKEGKLEDVSLGIMDGLYNEFVQQGDSGEDWGNRQVIIKFMERYRTAFQTRDIALLDSLFAEEAVIIVGRVLHKTKKKDVYAYARLSDEQPEYETIRYTKEQYLRNQKKVFEVQRDILLGYSTFKIHRKNKQPGVYGISTRQNYTSTTYADEGYLFLLVDFNDSLPQIYVRSWQPQEWSEESLVRLANFNINK